MIVVLSNDTTKNHVQTSLDLVSSSFSISISCLSGPFYIAFQIFISNSKTQDGFEIASPLE